MYVAGKEDATKGNLGTIVLPKPAGDVSINATLPDPVVFSYTNTANNTIRLREALVKINSDATPPPEGSPPRPSSCTVSVLAPVVDDNWVTMTEDVTLVMPTTTPSDGSKTDPEPDPEPALRNPHGLAQNGDYLYFIDYESQHIVIVGKDALETPAKGANVEVAVCDLEEELNDPNAKGQAIIALGGKIYALYLSANAYATNHFPGHLLRLDIDATDETILTVGAHTRVGLNPQSIIPVNDGTNVQLLIPAIGGPQGYTGATNGTASDISVVPALGNWPASPARAPRAVTGDPMPQGAAETYDIHAVAAAMRGGDSELFILTQIYDNNAKKAFWRLYQISVSDFLALLTEQPPLTLSAATAMPDRLEVQDGGVMVSPDVQIPYDIYFWDLLYEQTLRNDDEEDRLWLVLGSPFLITKAEAYGSPTTELGNPYVMFSGFGGVNVNSVDLTIETLNQARREVSLKRGVRASKLGSSTAAAAVTATASAAEEEEEK
jgi:hypothetical protein